MQIYTQIHMSQGIMEAQIQYCEGQIQTKLLPAREIRRGFPEKGRETFYYVLVVCPVQNRAAECFIQTKLKYFHFIHVYTGGLGANKTAFQKYTVNKTHIYVNHEYGNMCLIPLIRLNLPSISQVSDTENQMAETLETKI